VGEARALTQLKTIPDARIHFEKQSGSGGRDVTVYITGDRARPRPGTAEKVVEEMRALPSLHDARINGDMQRPEIVTRTWTSRHSWA
jgi:hypothetical protein